MTHFKSVSQMYYHWLKTYGGDAIWHEEEIIGDIEKLVEQKRRVIRSMQKCDRGLVDNCRRWAKKA